MGTGEKKYRREINRVLNHFVLRDGEMDYPVRDHPDAREMIIEFAEPLNGLFESLTTRYSMAIFAWNLSLVQEERRPELMTEFLTPIVGDNEEGLQTISELIDALVERRIEHYPEDTFLILPTQDDDTVDPADSDPVIDDEDDVEEEDDEALE